MSHRDFLNDPPISESEWARMRKEHPPCPECRREPWKGHWPWCSKAEPAVREYYADSQQRADYRRAVRELGCNCAQTLAPQTHAPGCPYLEEYLSHLDEEHVSDVIPHLLRSEVDERITKDRYAERSLKEKYG